MHELLLQQLHPQKHGTSHFEESSSKCTSYLYNCYTKGRSWKKSFRRKFFKVHKLPLQLLHQAKEESLQLLHQRKINHGTSHFEESSPKSTTSTVTPKKDHGRSHIEGLCSSKCTNYNVQLLRQRKFMEQLSLVSVWHSLRLVSLFTGARRTQ